jgi:hypothetical protein
MIAAPAHVSGVSDMAIVGRTNATRNANARHLMTMGLAFGVH